MKNLFPWMGLVMVALGLASCNPSKVASPHTGHGHAHGHEEGSTNFEKGKGVILSEKTIASLKLQLAEVTERPLSSILVATAQIYRSADEDPSKDGSYKRGHAYASASVSSETSGDIKTVSNVEIRTSKGEERSCNLLRVDDSLKSATRTVEALLEIPDSSHSLPIGAFVKATFHFNNVQAALVIPKSGLLKTVEGSFVYVQNGKHLLRTPIQVGMNNADWVEIKDGLLPGDVIATTRVETLWLTELRATKGGGHSH